MKIYRIAYYNHSYESRGFTFHTSMKEAIKTKASWMRDNGKLGTCEIGDPFDIPLTVKGVLEALTFFGSHNDNG